MTSTFPTNYDTFSTKVDYVTRVMADHINTLQSCVSNIETELGLGSKGEQINLTDRLNISLDQYGYYVDYFYNKSGQTLTPGQVVVRDTANNSSVKLNSTLNEPNVIGVVTSSTEVNELVPVKTKGNVPVYLIADGVDIAPGDLLVSSSYPGFLTKASESTTSVIGRSNVSLTSGSSGVCSVNISFTDNLLMDHTHNSSSPYDGGTLGDDVVDSRVLKDTDANYQMAGLVISGNLAVSGNVIVLGDQIISNTEVVSGNKAIFSNMDVNGDSYLGNESTDTTYIQGNFYVAEELPSAVNSYATINIGKLSSVWKYLQYLYDFDTFYMNTGLETEGEIVSPSIYTQSIVVSGGITTNTLETQSLIVSGDLITQNLETNNILVLEELDTNNNKILNVATPEVSGDAANKYYIDTVSQEILNQSTSYTNEASSNLIDYINENAGGNLEQTLIKGNSAGSYEIDMNNNKIINVATPVVSGDVANKHYVDTVVSEIVSGGGGGGSGTGITWNEVTGISQSAAADNGYVTDNISQVTITLPNTCAFGKTIAVCGKGTGGWKIAQNTGQTVHYINISTTTGTSGYIESTSQYDTLQMVCTTANTDFTVVNSVGTVEMI